MRCSRLKSLALQWSGDDRAPLWGLPEVDEHDLVMSTDEAYLDALEHDPLKGFDGGRRAKSGTRWTTAGYDVRKELPALDLPVLMINGEHDDLRAAAQGLLDSPPGTETAGGNHPRRSSRHQAMSHIIRIAALIAEACLSVLRG